MEYNEELREFNFLQLKEELDTKIYENRSIDLKFGEITKKLDKIIGQRQQVVAG